LPNSDDFESIPAFPAAGHFASQHNGIAAISSACPESLACGNHDRNFRTGALGFH
jgi:hypothetical protein